MANSVEVHEALTMRRLVREGPDGFLDRDQHDPAWEAINTIARVAKLTWSVDPEAKLREPFCFKPRTKEQQAADADAWNKAGTKSAKWDDESGVERTETRHHKYGEEGWVIDEIRDSHGNLVCAAELRLYGVLMAQAWPQPGKEPDWALGRYVNDEPHWWEKQ